MLDLVVPINVAEAELNKSLHELRDFRIQLAHDQLMSIEKTVDDMIDRGLARPRQRNRLLREVSSVLVDRIMDLSKRKEEPDSLYFDELLLYLDLMPEKEKIGS